MPYADYEQHKAQARAYHHAHREQKNAYARAWRAQNRERHRAAAKAWARAHPEQVRIKKLAWHHANKEKRKTYTAKYYEKNRERICMRNEAWRKAHPETSAMMAQRRRARKANAGVNDLTVEQWRNIKEHYHHQCVYCGKKQQRLTQDHILPLIKGGTHTVTNIVPACRQCNSKKGTGNPLIPIQPLLLI